jgi:hypothetical protein
VGSDRALAAAAIAGWSTVGMAEAGDRECDLLRSARRHSLAHAAAVLPAAADGLWMVRGLRASSGDEDCERAGREASSSAAAIDGAMAETG